MDGEAIRELNLLHTAAQEVRYIDGVPFNVDGNGNPISMVHLMRRPPRIEEDTRFSDVASFVAYVNKFKSDSSMLVLSGNTVVAHLDYHSPGSPSHCSHTASLALTRPGETMDWLLKNSKLMEQSEFADFVEDHLDQIESPNGATLMEIVNEFRVKTDAKFESKISQANGSVTFNFTEEHNGTYGPGKQEVPKQFTILLVPYIGIDEGVVLTANLRWRISGGKLHIGYKIPGLEKALREIDDKVRNTIGDQVGIPVYK